MDKKIDNQDLYPIDGIKRQYVSRKKEEEDSPAL